ncbi:hypothetical protein BB559_002879 [Furculomyces boomerangus]|uniref:Major facilitator superfamily (MFS) profile domain-containing protein n=1 Tax=Furculomyces boomerangus TaxID=61424 RepID=A0A2T9YRH9_9FUNG|nr:hypothetical protein BB559_002879 [Furculomyces boomerangus]
MTSTSGLYQNNTFTYNCDGKRAFLMLLLASILKFIIIGILSSHGVLHYVYIQKFKDSFSVKEIGWIGISMLVFAFTFSLIASKMIRKYGLKVTVIGGGLLSSCGLISAGSSNNVYTLCATQGIIFGIGAALPFMCAVYIVSIWFNKHRGFGMGTINASGALGGIFYTFLYKKLIPFHGYRYALRVNGIIVITVITICGIIVHERTIQGSIYFGKLRIFANKNSDISTTDSQAQEENNHESIVNIPVQKNMRKKSERNKLNELQSYEMVQLNTGSGTCPLSITKDEVVNKMQTKALSKSNSALVGKMGDTNNKKGIILNEDSRVGSIKSCSFSNRFVYPGINEYHEYCALKEQREKFKNSLESRPNFILPDLGDEEISILENGGGIISRIKKFGEIGKEGEIVCREKILKEPFIYLASISGMLADIGYNAPSLYLTIAISNRGGNFQSASSVVWILGLGKVFGSLFFGGMVDILGESNTAIISNFLAALFTIVMWRPQSSPNLLVAYGFIFGFLSSGIMCAGPALVSRHYKSDKVGIAIGFMNVFLITGIVIGGQGMAAIYDTYKEAMDTPLSLLCSGGFFLSALFMTLCQLYLRKKNPHKLGLKL